MTPKTPSASLDPHGSAHDCSDSARPAPVTIIEAPPKVPGITIARLRTRDLSTAVCAPAPGNGRKIGPATEVLEALGKRRHVTGRPRGRTEVAELVPIWLTAHRVRRLYAVPNPDLGEQGLNYLAEMLQLSPTRLLFVCDHGHGDELARQLRAHAPQRSSWPEDPRLTTTDPLPAYASIEPPEQWSATSTRLPTEEYWTFYATARRVLTPSQFAPIERLYRTTYRRVAEWLGELGNDAEHLTVDSAFDCLRTLIEEQLTADDVIVVTRAAQAAHHCAGWLLNVDERELRNGLIRFPPSKATDQTYEVLRAIFDPARAATVALYLAGATATAIQATRVDDLAQWHRETTRPVANITPPVAAAPYLRAALMNAAVEGFRPTDAAFPGDRRRVLRDIRQAANDLGLNIGDANLDKNAPIGTRRVPRRVIKLERLA